jgi:acyl carrier protein phosphodiesterase
MNFLGHLYFSDNNIELMYANLFGDFVKGKDLSEYSDFIQKGIHLHRTIDSYIDHHPIVLELLHKLYPLLPKVSGIAVDIYFDHLLARNWDTYSSTNRDTFIDNFYNYPIERNFGNDHFWDVIDRMKKGQWLFKYKSMEGLTKACQGLSNRISFPNVLDQAPDVFIQNELMITQAFHKFMQEAKEYFEAYYEENIRS